MRISIPKLSLFFALIILGCESESNDIRVVMEKNDLINYLENGKDIYNIEISNSKTQRSSAIINIIALILSSQALLFIIQQFINKREKEKNSAEQFIQLVVTKQIQGYEMDTSDILCMFNARGRKLKKIVSSEEVRNYFKESVEFPSNLRDEMERITELVKGRKKNGK